MQATGSEHVGASAGRGTTKGQMISAMVLAVGLLCTGYGFLRSQTAALYAGLTLTLAGVLTGLAQLLWPTRK